MIPARIIKNWDFTPFKVCRASLQELNILYTKPCINMHKLNPKLFNFIQKLNQTRKIREDLNHMRKYLTVCREAIAEKLLETNIGPKQHLIYYPQMYSISDLVAVEHGTINYSLNKSYTNFENHIRNCEICLAKAYYCEICSNREIIFPFDDAAVPCDKCNAIYHRVCWIRRNSICPKCIRIASRRSLQSTSTDNDNDADDTLEGAVGGVQNSTIENAIETKNIS